MNRREVNNVLKRLKVLLHILALVPYHQRKNYHKMIEATVKRNLMTLARNKKPHYAIIKRKNTYLTKKNNLLA